MIAIITNVIVQLLFWLTLIIGFLSGPPSIKKTVDEDGTEHWKMFGVWGLPPFLLLATTVFKYLCS